MTLRLTIGFSDNPRVEPLKDATVKPQNIELGFVTLDPSTLFWRNQAALAEAEARAGETDAGLRRLDDALAELERTEQR
jgi:hypothetical protein